MSTDRSGANDTVTSSLNSGERLAEGPRVIGIGHFIHRDAEGNVLDEWTETNLVTNTGRANYLKAELKGNTAVQASSWFVGLIQGTSATVTLNSSDTADSTTLGWSESTNYSEATRPSWDSGTVGSTATATVSNSTSTATFSINANSTARGVFLASSNVKGNAGSSGNTWTLHSEIEFSQTRSMSSGDTLDVTYTQQVTT